MNKLKSILSKVVDNKIISMFATFILGLLVATIPLILAYEWKSNDVDKRSKPYPSVQLLDVNLSFEINDKVTYSSEEFKIPEFLFEEVTGNPYIYALPKLSQSIPYKSLRNYFITSHNYNKEQPNDIESMMTKYKKVYSCLNSEREIDQDEIDAYFLYITTYENRIFHQYNELINYGTDTEIEEYFKKSTFFNIFNDEIIDMEKPQKISKNIQEKLSKRKKYFKYYDFITDEKIGWKISSDNLFRSLTTTYRNYKLDPDDIRYMKFYVYSLIYYDKESLKLILDLLYKAYSDVDSIRKKIMVSQSVNYDTMKYFSRFKVSALFLNKGKKPITFMPNSTLIIENDDVFEYEYFDGSSYVRKALPDEIKIELAYYKSFKTKAPFRLEENESKIITMISEKQIKDIIDYQGVLKAFNTGALRCKLQGIPVESESRILSNKINFKQSDESFIKE